MPCIRAHSCRTSFILLCRLRPSNLPGYSFLLLDFPCLFRAYPQFKRENNPSPLCLEVFPLSQGGQNFRQRAVLELIRELPSYSAETIGLIVALEVLEHAGKS